MALYRLQKLIREVNTNPDLRRAQAETLVIPEAR